jgi:plastocyanin
MRLHRGHRLHRLHLPVAVVVASIAMALPTLASSAPLPVEAVNEGAGIYGIHSWSHAQQTILPGEKVKFSNPYTTTYHGLKFTGGPATSCSGIPQMATEPIGAFHWEGECTFSTPGTYTFICTVHPTEMKGTITVPGTAKGVTIAAGGETQTEATLNGSVEPEGNATAYHFEYGLSLSEHTTPAASLGATDFTSHSVSAPLTGLLPGKTYHVELVVTYGASNTVRGGERTFTTPAAAAPTAETTTAGGLQENEATLKGTVDPEGGGKAEYFFQWGIGPSGPSYEHETTPVSLPADGAQHAVSAALNGLTPGTEYHFRVVATNDLGGPVPGKDIAFKSLSSPAPKSEPPAEPPRTTTPSTLPPNSPVLPSLLSKPEEKTSVFGAPLVEGSVKLSVPRHGSTVHGSLDVAQSGARGKLEVDLLAKSASLAAAHRSGSVRVGRFVHASVSIGTVPFSVALTSRGKSALRRHHRLALSVKITLTPARGAAVTITRSVTLRS